MKIKAWAVLDEKGDIPVAWRCPGMLYVFRSAKEAELGLVYGGKIVPVLITSILKDKTIRRGHES